MKELVDTREVVSEFAPRYVRGRTLDIGGGTSKYRGLIAPHASSYEVADLHEPGADHREDARRMTFPDASFDSVVSFQLLEHVDDVSAAIAEMYRVLRSGGHILITAPFLFPQHGDPSDFHRFTKDALRFHLERAGFTVVELGSQGGFWAVVSGLLRQMYFSHYRRYGRIKSFLFPRFLRALLRLDRTWGRHPDVYTNVYAVGKKPV